MTQAKRITRNVSSLGSRVSSPQNLNLFWSRLIIEELLRLGVACFAVAPGSRSAPLALAAAGLAGERMVVHFDERGLGFYALGRTAGGQPTALICTSGTAAANLFPAVIEASKKKLPLIVLSADRPPELRATGANQTIDQVKLFGDYVRHFVDLPCPTEEIPPQAVLTTVDAAMARARGNPPGPVHLNCMFREPLSRRPDGRDLAAYGRPLSSWRKSSSPFTRYGAAETAPLSDAVKPAAERLRAVRHGVIAVGKLRDRREAAAVLKLAERLQWPVFPDLSSGLRLGCDHPLVVPYFDRILVAAENRKSLTPEFDGVLQLGGRMTSKAYMRWLARVRPPVHVTVLNHPLRNDPEHLVTDRLQGPVGRTAARLAAAVPRHSGGKSAAALRQASDFVHDALNEYFANNPALSGPAVAQAVSQALPKNAGLFLSNSLPVREMDAFADARAAGAAVTANRGASGIDGNIASAAGFAAALGRPTVMLAGDLAFLHDLNSLALAARADRPLVIVLDNNDGGGIFSFLPVKDAGPDFERVFAAPHGLGLRAAGELFDIPWILTEDRPAFTAALKAALRRRGPSVIEVRGDREENRKEHERITDIIRKKIGQLKVKGER